MMKQRQVLLTKPKPTESQSKRKPQVEPRRAKPKIKHHELYWYELMFYNLWSWFHSQSLELRSYLLLQWGCTISLSISSESVELQNQNLRTSVHQKQWFKHHGSCPLADPPPTPEKTNGRVFVASRLFKSRLLTVSILPFDALFHSAPGISNINKDHAGKVWKYVFFQIRQCIFFLNVFLNSL